MFSMNNVFLLIGGLGTPELIVIAIVLLLLFGGTQLPKLARAIGQSKKEFQKGIKEGENDDDDKSFNSPRGNKSLSGISDEELFEEAHRRAQEVRK